MIDDEVLNKSDLICFTASSTCYVFEIKIEHADYETALQMKNIISWYEYVGKKNGYWDDVCGVVISNKFTKSCLDSLWKVNCKTLKWIDDGVDISVKEIKSNKKDLSFI
jgi:hypothetical protein